MTLPAGIFVALFVAAIVAWGSVSSSAIGLNFKTLRCPRCIRPVHRGTGIVWVWRFLFGGATCAECHSVVDKWGRERMPGERFRRRAQRMRRD